MVAWAACVLAVSLALCIAARLAEQACRLRRLSTRGCWFAALLSSVLLPLAAPLLPATALRHLPGLPVLPALVQPLARHATAARALPAPAPAADASAATAARVERLAAAMPALALALSAGMLAMLALTSLRLQRRARSWRPARIGGLEVLLAPAAGPAVFGWWRPRVVLPEWLGRHATRERSLALAHERSHLQALDPQLLAASLLLLAAMPWNLPMWWQLRRLRCAIEVDCDLRVLRAGGDLVDYCETLIALGQQRGSQRGLMAAVSEPQSLLERRIRIMSARTSPWSRTAALACTAVAATLATCAVAMAAGLAPPAPPAPVAAVAPVPAIVAAAPPPPHVARVAPAPPPPPAPPAALAQSRKHAAEGADAQDGVSPEQQALENAKREAEEAQERADEAKADAEEAERDALEAKHDAEQQAADAQEAKRDAERQEADAQQAKRAAEAAAAEAAARKQDAESAARALHPATAAG